MKRLELLNKKIQCNCWLFPVFISSQGEKTYWKWHKGPILSHAWWHWTNPTANLPLISKDLYAQISSADAEQSEKLTQRYLTSNTLDSVFLTQMNIAFSQVKKKKKKEFSVWLYWTWSYFYKYSLWWYFL